MRRAARAQAKAFQNGRLEKKKMEKLVEKTKLERERCCAGRDALERFCKEYLDQEVLERDVKREAAAEDAAKAAEPPKKKKEKKPALPPPQPDDVLESALQEEADAEA